MTSVVVPRSIAWISTVTPDEAVENLAPHSFFGIAGTDPPIVQFTSICRKDFLRHVEDTGEFVVNFSSEPLPHQDLPRGSARGVPRQRPA